MNNTDHLVRKAKEEAARMAKAAVRDIHLKLDIALLQFQNQYECFPNRPKTGEYLRSFPNGTPWLHTYYDDGKVTGAFEEYDSIGNVVSQKFYVDSVHARNHDRNDININDFEDIDFASKYYANGSMIDEEKVMTIKAILSAPKSVSTCNLLTKLAKDYPWEFAAAAKLLSNSNQ